MSIGDLRVQSYETDDRDNFVSWMPAAGDEKSHSGKDKGDGNENILRDLTYEGYSPDHIIEIPTTEIQERKMVEYWRNFRSKTVSPDVDKRIDAELHGSAAPSYRFLVKNCSTAVARVLKSGEISCTSYNPFRKHKMIWTPVDVKNLALGYKGATKKLWVDWVDSTQLTHDEKTLLKYYLKRHGRHGSTGAKSRNKVSVNVRVLHLLQPSEKAPYHNAAITRLIRNFGRGGGDLVVVYARGEGKDRGWYERQVNLRMVREWLSRGEYDWLEVDYKG